MAPGLGGVQGAAGKRPLRLADVCCSGLCRGASRRTGARLPPSQIPPHCGGVAQSASLLLSCVSDPCVLVYARPVQAFIEHSMGRGAAAKRPAELCAPLLAHLHLRLRQRQVELLSPAAATSAALNAAMQMLQAAAHAGAELAEGGFQLDGFEGACLAARSKLEAAAAARALRAAEGATLPPLDGSSGCSPCCPGSYRCPRGVVPAQRSPSQEAEGLDAAKQRAAANLGSLPVPAEAAGQGAAGWLAALHAALEKCTKQAGGSDMAAQHVLSMVERELFNRAADDSQLRAAAALGEAGINALWTVVQSYRKGEPGLCCGSEGWPLHACASLRPNQRLQHIQRMQPNRCLQACDHVPGCWLPASARVVSHSPSSARRNPLCFLAVLNTFLGTPASRARMRVELRSRELLVTWVAYCMADVAACRTHPLVASYGVSLREDDLRHLVLSDRQACDVLLGVAAYLRQRGSGRPLFSLAHGGITFSFAAKFAEGDSGMAGTLQREQAAAAARQAEHWRQVQEKQREVARLRAQLAQEQQAVAAATAAYEAAYRECIGALDRRGILRSERDRCKSWLSSAQRAVSSTQALLNAALAAPTPVIQPLPQDASLARQTIFFAYCPQLLRWALQAVCGAGCPALAPCSGRLGLVPSRRWASLHGMHAAAAGSLPVVPPCPVEQPHCGAD